MKQEDLEELSKFLGWLCRRYKVPTPIINICNETVYNVFDDSMLVMQAGRLSYGPKPTIALFPSNPYADMMVTLAHELHHLRKDIEEDRRGTRTNKGYIAPTHPEEIELDRLAGADLKEYRLEQWITSKLTAVLSPFGKKGGGKVYC